MENQKTGATIASVDTQKQRVDRFVTFFESDPANEQLLLDASNMAIGLGYREPLVKLSNLCESNLSTLTPTAICQLATIYLHLSDGNNASKYYEEAIAKGIDDPAVRYNLAYSFFVLKDFNSSLDALTDITADSLQEETLSLKAKLMHHLEDLDSAIESLETLVSIGNPSSETYAHLALLQYENYDNTDIALDNANKALKTNPNELNAILTRAAIFMDEDKSEESIAEYNRAIEHHPDSGRAWSGLAQVYFNSFKFDQAKESVDLAVKHMPDHIGTWHLQGWTNIMLGDFEASLKSFEDCLQLDKRFGDTHGGIAASYALMGKETEARRSLRMANRLDPFSFAAVFAQMVLLNKDNQPEEAMKIFENAKDMRHPVHGFKPRPLIEKRLNQLFPNRNTTKH